MAEGKSRTSLLTNTAKIAVTIGIVAFIVNRLGWSEIVSTLRMADYRLILASCVVFFVSGVLGVVQWQVLLTNKGVRLSFGRAFVLYFVGMFFNNFVFGFIAGDAVKVALLKNGSGDAKSGLAATFLDRFAGLMAMAGLAVFGSAVLLKRGVLQDGRIFTASIALVGAFALFCGVLVFLVSTRVQKVAFRALAAMPLPGKDFLSSLLGKIVLEVKDRAAIVPIALLSLGIQLMRVGVHILCAAALGLLSAENFQYFFVFVPILAMMMIIPMPFGIKEGLGGSLFLLAGFSPNAPEAPIVMEFLASLVGVGVSLVGGVMFVTNRMSQKLPEEVRS